MPESSIEKEKTMQKKVIRTSCSILLVLTLSLFCVTSLWAGTVYLKNGDEVDCQSFKSKKGITYVMINHYTMVTFNNSEVDMARTYHKKAIRHKRHLHKKKKAVHKAPEAVSSKTDVTPKQPLPKVQPVPLKPGPAKPIAAKPAPVKPVPVKPVPAKPAPVKPVPAKPVPAKPMPVKPMPVKPVPAKPVSPPS